MGKFTKSTIYRFIFWGLYYCLIFLIFFHSSFNSFDPDFGWHLRVGADISRTQEVPRANLYNFSLTGNWVDHEWLGDWVLYKLYVVAGYPLVVVFFSLLGLATFALLHREIKKRFPNTSSGLIIFFQLLGLLAIIPHIGVRLQLLGLLFLILLLSLLSLFDRRADRRLLLVLPPFFLLWASIHASFLLGLFLVFAWLAIRGAESAAAYLKPQWKFVKISLNLRNWLQYLTAAICSVIATLLTPYRLELYAFLSGYRDTFYQTRILEWLPQYFFPFQYFQIFYLALIVAILIIYWREAARLHDIDYWEFFLLILFFAMSWRARRHFPLFVVATMPLIVFYSQRIVDVSGQPLKSFFAPWHKMLVIFCLVILCAALYFDTRITSEPFTAHCENYPCQAAEFLRSRPDLDGQRLFNHYGWGGYLIWQLPSRQLFIDGRLPQAEYLGHTFLEEYYDFFASKSSAQSKLEQHGIGLVLLPTQDKVSRYSRLEKIFFRNLMSGQSLSKNLRAYLDEAGWNIIYQDRTAVIYARP